MGTSPYFNFASLIALLAALAFSLPFVVRLAEKLGVDRSFGIVVTLAAALVALAFVLIRNRLKHKERIVTRIAQIQQQIDKSPSDLTAYSYQSDHLADLHLTLGQNQEALDVFQAYLKLLEEAENQQKNNSDEHYEANSEQLKEKERVILAIERLDRLD